MQLDLNPVWNASTRRVDSICLGHTLAFRKTSFMHQIKSCIPNQLFAPYLTTTFDCWFSNVRNVEHNSHKRFWLTKFHAQMCISRLWYLNGIRDPKLCFTQFFRNAYHCHSKSYPVRDALHSWTRSFWLTKVPAWYIWMELWLQNWI